MDITQLRVDAYRNLHKPGVTYSLRGVSSGLVRGYATAVLLADAEFKVSQAGRLRVIAQRRKNVHAFVRGTPKVVSLAEVDSAMSDLEEQLGGTFTKVTYNPYRFTSFVRVLDSSAIHRATVAVLKDDGCWVIESR